MSAGTTAGLAKVAALLPCQRGPERLQCESMAGKKWTMVSCPPNTRLLVRSPGETRSIRETLSVSQATGLWEQTEQVSSQPPGGAGLRSPRAQGPELGAQQAVGRAAPQGAGAQIPRGGSGVSCWPEGLLGA